MAGRFLDLDPVRQPVGTFRLEGVDYVVWPLRIKQIINLSAQSDDQQRNLATMVSELQETIPDCPREVLERMDINQLTTLSQWIQEGGSADAEKNSTPPAPVEPAAAPAAA